LAAQKPPLDTSYYKLLNHPYLPGIENPLFWLLRKESVLRKISFLCGYCSNATIGFYKACFPEIFPEYFSVVFPAYLPAKANEGAVTAEQSTGTSVQPVLHFCRWSLQHFTRPTLPYHRGKFFHTLFICDRFANSPVFHQVLVSYL
jgi:hypothetical protein